MNNLFKKNSISIINKKWEVIKSNVNLKHIPRYGELIYLEDHKMYFKVLNVVYYINKKEGIFIVVEEFSEKLQAENQ